jgi:hypothetical protein
MFIQSIIGVLGLWFLVALGIFTLAVISFVIEDFLEKRGDGER